VRISYDFRPVGYVAEPEAGMLYVDIGNAFCPGILDHHHPEAPDACTAMLVLNHPEYVVSQIIDGRLAIIPHEYPDLDAVTGVYFARMHANGGAVQTMHHEWAAYVCRIDQGFTSLNMKQPVTPYSLFMIRMQLLQEKLPDDVHAASLMMLESGFGFLGTIFGWMEKGGNLNELAESGMFPAEEAAIAEDMEKYRRDIQRADTFTCTLPHKDGKGRESVPCLWIEMPESALFKSWARGDVERYENNQGFVFLGIQVSEHRFILSVNPSSNVYLKGLGDLIEQAEIEKRSDLGMERKGENRPGYDSPDPWYDGRSPLHNYTIIDSPRAGTVLGREELRSIFRRYVLMAVAG